MSESAKRLVEEKINKTIAARNHEMEAIKKKFDRVLEGGSGVVAIGGKPGIGKTFLVNQAVKDLANCDVTYVYGKFRQHDEKPFIAISEVIEQMVKHLLTLPFEQLENTKKALITVLGSDIEILTSIVPYVGKLLGHHKMININDYEKLKYRAKKALYQFLATVSQALFPMILFIDDLQWADTPSLEVIELLCKDHELLNLLLIIAYRDHEEKSIEKVTDLTNIPQIKDNYMSIQLQELMVLDIKVYLQFIFGVNAENIDYLARMIYGLTLGNPFYIKEIIDIFIKEGIVVYLEQSKRWGVKFDSLNHLSLPNDIEQILTQKINQLSDEDKSSLELIACLDGKVEYETLKNIVNIDDVLLVNKLEILCQSAFLIKKTDEYQGQQTISYGFVHDILLEFIYNDINPAKKAGMHYKIAKKWAGDEPKTFTVNNRLFLASQLLRADFNELIQGNPDKWMHELYLSGMQAKQTAAIEQALKIFECCEKLLPYCDLKDENDLEMRISLELAECQFIHQRYEEASIRFEALISNYHTVENLIIIKRKYMNLYAYNGNSEKVLELGAEILNHLNYRFDTRDIEEETTKGKLLFSNSKIEDLQNAPFIQDKRILQIMETLTQMIPAANIVDDQAFDLILMKIANLSAQYGNSLYSPIGYAAYSYIFYNIWQDPENGERLKDIALDLLEDTDDSATRIIVYSLIGTFIDHWSNPMEKSLEYLHKAIEEGSRAGEFIFSAYCIVSTIYVKYVTGTPLKEIHDYINHQLQKTQWIADDIINFVKYIFISHINYLEKGELTLEGQQIKDQVGLCDNAKSLVYYIFMLQRLYMEREIEKAYKLAVKITPDISHLKGHIIYLDLLFYSILTRIAGHQALTTTQKRENKELINKYMQEMAYWIGIYNGNHYARHLLVKAEYAACFEQEKPLDKLYNEAISFAEEHGHLQIEAIADLLAAKHYHYNRKLSKFYAREAADLFKKWGALNIADGVEKQFGLQNNTELPAEQQPIMNTESTAIDKSILYYLKQIEDMEEEQGFIYMLDFLTQSNYADYGTVLFEKCDELHLWYEKKSRSKAVVHKEPVNIKHVDHIPRKVIQYAARTGEEVIINQKPDSGIFAADQYLINKEEISIICIPIKYLGVFVGVIYLESRYNDGFNEDIIPMIKSVIPVLISKRTTIKDVNLQNLLNPQEAVSPLTDREREVLELTAEGMSNSAISKQLHISQGTVKTHLSNIYSKLEVDSRIKAVVRARDLNIIKI